MALRNRTVLATLALVLAATSAVAQKQYSPGASNTEIKIGTTTPYSGPASAYSAGAVSITAYFRMLNQQAGGNGSKHEFRRWGVGHLRLQNNERTGRRKRPQARFYQPR